MLSSVLKTLSYQTSACTFQPNLSLQLRTLFTKLTDCEVMPIALCLVYIYFPV